MSLKWDDSLLIGNAEIDEQHREIFRHFERLSTACMAGVCEEELKGLLKFLDDYVIRHFSHEEAFMAKNHYPKLHEQQVQHAGFRSIVKKMQDTDMKNIEPDQLSLLIYRQLVLWFNQHIKQSDQEMINYFLAQQHY